MIARLEMFIGIGCASREYSGIDGHLNPPTKEKQTMGVSGGVAEIVDLCRSKK